jgi:wyosine [tRNA(Phe)-imidazoG37] synthetase (radical SAM superfamily)
VNHVPAKHCTYSCAYCQLGPTVRTETARRAFLPAEIVVREVARKVARCRTAGCRIDHITFVPDGEPTLDRSLGAEIRGVKALGIPVAVLTNGSLLSRAGVREDLAAADRVCVKVDAVDEPVWRRLNRPGVGLDHHRVLDGILEFARGYVGVLDTETMLVRGVNDDLAGFERTVAFLEMVAPRRAYLASPVRPPADPRVRPAVGETLARACAALRKVLPDVELLGDEAPGSFDSTATPLDDLLAILAVHPMRAADVRRFAADTGLEPRAVDRLLREGRARRVRWRGKTFLVGSQRGVLSDGTSR